MERDIDEYEIDSSTNVEIERGTLTVQEAQWLKANGVLRITGYKNETGKATNVVLDVEKLSRIAFEFDLLQQVASSVQTEILEAFRRSTDNTLTTSEIAQLTDRPKSSVSRALGQLTEKGKLQKVQSGVYRS